MANRPKSLSPEDLTRFMGKVFVTEGCWYWRGARDRKGYGRFWFEGRTRGAHRVAALIFGAGIPEGMVAMHTCDNPPCVNPSHVVVGTVADNNADRARKGRSAPQAGQCNGNARLTEDAVREIRRRYAAGGVSQRQLAREFGVGQMTVSYVVRRVTHAEVV